MFNVEPNVVPFGFGIILCAGLGALALWLGRALQQARARTAAQTRDIQALTHIQERLTNADCSQAVADALDALLGYSHAAAAQVWFKSDSAASFTPYLHRGLFPESFTQVPAASEKISHFSALDALPNLSAKGFVELVQIPLLWQRQVVGMLEIAARHRGELRTLADEWCYAVGRALAAKLEAAQELEHVRAQLAAEKRLWEAGLEVTATEDYDQVLRTIVERARELIHAEASALCLWNQEKEIWVVQGTSGTPEAFAVETLQFERGDGGRVECPVVRFKFRQAHLDLPVRRNGHIVGCLCVASQTPREYSAEERALLMGIASQAALAVERARALQTMGSRAATAERERLAREIHDTLAQILGFVHIKTGVVQEWLTQGNLAQAQTELEQLSRLSQELYQDTRELVLGLHGETDATHDLADMIQTYLERFSQFCNLPTTFERGDLDVTFPPAVEVQLLRVVQEALSNVRKHARAKHAWVSLRRAQDQALLEIRDDGQGFDPAHPTRGFGPRFGLQSMRERVESIHGAFAVHSAPGQGTRIQVTVPIIYRGQDV